MSGQLNARTRWRAVAGTALLVSALLLPLASPMAQDSSAARDIPIVMTEGTNMAVAASPDGSTLAMALQGALWTLPVTGGDAQRLTDWTMEVTAPSWSPDGTQIAFQNYEGHYYQVWIADRDGSNARAVTSGPWDHREPMWFGGRIAFSSDRSGEGTYDIWTLTLDTGEYQRWTQSPTDAHSPAGAPDGTQIAYVDGNVVRSVDATGQTQTLGRVSEAEDEVFAPAWLPDGTGLMYQNHERQLVVQEHVVTQDEDIFPFPVSWLPDGRFVYTADGQIKVRTMASPQVQTVPFRAAFTLQRPVIAAVDHRFDDSAPQPVRGLYSPALSRDGTQVAFTALNDLWVMRIGEAPVRLTDDAAIEGTVFWGTQDARIYFTSDRHGDGRPDLYAITPATLAIERITQTLDARMISPAMAPDGTRIAFIDGRDQSLWVYELASGQARHVLDQNYGNSIGRPTWAPDSRTVAFAGMQRANTRYREGRNLIQVVDVETGEWKFHEPAPLPEQLSDRFEAGPVWSPDGRWMAFIMRSVLHVMPVAADGTPTGAARALSTDAADMPEWSADSQRILYLASGELRTVRVDGSDTQTIPVALQWQRPVATGLTHVLAGGLWDGVEPTLQQNRLLVLQDSRIVEIRDAGRNPAADAAAAGARFIDASALTVMPGLWDAHVHPRVLDLTAQWYAVQSAFGLTSVLSNGGSTYHTMLIHEAIESGKLLGPRMLTSPLFDGQRPFYGHHRSVHDEQALAVELDKARALEMDFLKVYVRAPVSYFHITAQAAQEMGVPSGSHFLSPGVQAGLSAATHLSASQRMGYSWAETAAGRSYQDVLTLFSTGDFDLSSHHSPRNNVLGNEPGLLEDPRFLRLMPENYKAQIINELSAAPTAGQLQTIAGIVATPADIAQGGGLVTIGSDTPLGWPALAMHAQMRAYALAVGNHAALQSVTINAARYAFADKDLGTVEVGKIADLIMVRGNPLEDVRHAAAVEMVMKNGISMRVADMLAELDL
jgi:Tol biopolymer transport system component